MVSVARSNDKPQDVLEELSSVSLSNSILQEPPASVPLGGYKIVYKQQSECALVLFSRHAQTSENLVIKLLLEYKDTRYSLKTHQERQLCQLEALKQNRVFTPNVYLGLVRVDVLNLEQGYISIDNFMANPLREMLDAEREYALVMRQLPGTRRVDSLLQKKKEAVLQDYIRLLAVRTAFLYDDPASSLSIQDEDRWGGPEQIEEKLRHNFNLLDLVLTVDENGSGKVANRLECRVAVLKETLYDTFTRWQSYGYFEQRVAEQRIKRCHGDLKSPNMWIMPKGQWQSEKDRVVVLDAADFNPSYTHIDVLSDVALLVVDIQARTQSSSLANLLIQDYLRHTKQQNTVSKAVLAYYIVEKAIVGAAVSIVYDKLLDLGLAFLETAEMRLQCLQDVRPGHSF